MSSKRSINLVDGFISTSETKPKKSRSNSIVMKGRSASIFLAKAKNPKQSVCEKTNAYFEHVAHTTSVSQFGGVITIYSKDEKFSPK